MTNMHSKVYICMVLNVAHFHYCCEYFCFLIFSLHEYILKKLHVFLCVYCEDFFFQMCIFNYYMCTCYATMCEQCKKLCKIK